MKSASKTLYLFDIDGTLIDMTKLHVKAYRNAYKEVTGVKVSEKFMVKQFGKVEKRLHESIFSHYNIKDKKKIKKVVDVYTKQIATMIKETNIKILPGVKNLLRTLKTKKQPIGVVTGNSEKIGKVILKKSGLYENFILYSYGKANKRAHIVRKAIAMAKGKKIKFEKVIVIGDSPFDVKAGKENKAFTVAVSTGRHSFNELKKEKPEVLLRSLENFNQHSNSLQ
jgi:phosphoglycolate phosphatase